MKLLFLGAAVLAALVGCSSAFGDSNSRDIQVRGQQSMPAAQLRTLRIENVVGAIVVTGSNAPAATVNYTKYAGHQTSIDNTQVIVDRTASEIDARTHYVKSGWFGSSGAGVDYTVAAPRGASVHLENVTGPITLRNMSGDVEISEVTGHIDAALGHMGGERTVKINSVSGGTRMQIARNSDVTIDVKSVSGGVHAFFPMSGDKGFVGQSVHSHLGNGTATIDINSVSGSIEINPR